MRVVIDTNVIVSGILKPYSMPGEIVRIMVSGAFEVCYDARIISEYRDVLNRDKFKFDKSLVEDTINYIENGGCNIAAWHVKEKTHDKNDQMFLEVAICGKVDILISGNKKDFPMNINGLKILSPREYLDNCK